MSIAAFAACGDNGVTPPDAPDIDAPEPVPAQLAMTPLTFSFASVTVNTTSAASTFMVSNTGELASGSINAQIQGAAAGDFLISANNCTTLDAGATCSVSVTFTPTSTGQKTASLVIAGTPGGSVSAALDGMGRSTGQLSISPSTGALGNVVVGATSSTGQTFTVTNTGQSATGNITVTTGGSNPTEFTKTADTCSSSTLASNATCSFTVDFEPTSVGGKSASFNVTASPGGAVNAVVTGTALAPATLDVSPSLQDFGSVVQGGQSTNVTFTVTNTGGVATGVIANTLTGADAAHFTLGSSNCAGITLAPAAACNIIVRFTPTTTGSLSAQLTVTGAPGGTDNATLLGTGIAPGQITITPTSAPFGNQTVGTSSGAQTFTVVNTGAAPTGTLSTALGGGDPSQFQIVANSNGCAGNVLAAGAQCTIAVLFAPTTGGAKSASLTVTGTPGGTVNAGLSGTGIAAAALSIAPNTKDFGSIGTGTVTSFQTFTITNTGGQASGVPTAVVGGANATQFQLAANTCTAAIPAGGNCTVQVRFAPTINGTFTGTLTVSATPGGAAVADLFGQGVNPAQISSDESSLAFGTEQIGDTTAPLQFTVTNDGTETTGTLALTVTGAAASDYTLTHNCTTLAMGFSCTANVTFSPSAVGSRTASVNVTGTPGGTFAVALSGTGERRLEVLTPAGATFAFGNVVVNTSAPPTVTINIRNNSDAASIITTTPNFGGQYNQVSNTCTGTLAVDATCTMVVSFRPTSTGLKDGSVVFAINGGGANNTATVTFTGTGVDSLTIAPVTVAAFGNVARGLVSDPSLVFRVTNPANSPTTGNINVQLAGAGYQITNNDCAGATLTGGASCDIRVIFAPTAIGASPGTLTVSASPGGTAVQNLTATGVEPATLTVNPTTLAFGNVFSGATATLTSIVTNTGGVSAGQLNFAVTGTGYSTAPFVAGDCQSGITVLAAGGTCNLRVRFQPTGTTFGAVAGNVSLTGNPGGTVNVPLTGTSVSTISIAPATFDFGGVNQGTTTNNMFTVTNNSASAVTITMAQLSPANPEVTITANTCTSVAANGGTCAITVRFAPGAPGTFTSTLTVSSANGIATATMTGRGNTVASVNWTEVFSAAAPFNFGATLAGENGFSRTFTLRNDGQATAPAITGLVLFDTVNYTITSQNCVGVALTPTSTCTATVRFNPMPSNGPTADLTSTLTVTGTTGTNTTLNLKGRRMTTGSIVFTPVTITFDPLVVGGTSGAQAFTVQNTSGSPVAFNTAVCNDASGAGCVAFSTHFTLVGGTCGTPVGGVIFGVNLAAGQSCTLTVQFNPAAVGVQSGALVARALSADVDAYGPVYGTGLAPAAVTRATTSGPGAAFGNVAVGATSSTTYTWTNTGAVASGQVVITGPTGASFNQFSITANTCTAALAPGASCSATVNFTPTTVGAKTASFNAVASPGYGSTDTALSGSGVLQAILGINPTVPQSAGSLAVGRNDVSAGTTYTISNGGDVATGDLSVGISDSTNWTITANNCPDGAPLPAGAMCNVTIKFNPTVVQNGLSTTLTVSASPGGTVTGTVTGNGTSALTSPATANLGSVAAGGSSGMVTVTYTNTANVATGVLHTAVGGANASMVTVETDACSGAVVPALGTCNVTVRFTPPAGTTAGPKTATLTVSGTPGNSATTTLNGSVP